MHSGSRRLDGDPGERKVPGVPAYRERNIAEPTAARVFEAHGLFFSHDLNIDVSGCDRLSHCRIGVGTRPGKDLVGFEPRPGRGDLQRPVLSRLNPDPASRPFTDGQRQRRLNVALDANLRLRLTGLQIEPGHRKQERLYALAPGHEEFPG